MRKHIYVLTLILLTVLGAGDAIAAAITVPVGLNPGDQYRLVFVTSTRRDATSSNIADYNSFVDNLAETVPELALLADDWKAIASTASAGGPIVDARTNTSTDPSVLAGVPIYLLNGTKLVDNYADLWDASIDVRLNVNELGNVQANARVWTGTTTAGAASGAGGNRALGYGTLAEVGVNTYTTADWITGGRESTALTRNLYGISSVLTVPIPEPTTALLFGLGLAGLAVRRK